MSRLTPPASDPLDLAVSHLTAISAPRLSEELRGSTRRLIMEAEARSVRRRIRRRWSMVSAAALLAIAAVLLLRTTGPNAAFGQVAANIRKTKTIRAVLLEPVEGKVIISGSHTRLEDKHSISIADSTQSVQLALMKDSKTAYRYPLRHLGPVVNLYELFRNPAAESSTSIADYVDKAGRSFQGLRSKIRIGGGSGPEVQVDVWSDPKTMLPVRLRIEPITESGHEAMVFDQLEYDVPVDESLFAMTIPAEYKLVGLPFETLEGPDSEQAAKLILNPGVGVGDVKFGMSRDEIVGVLGEPDLTLHGIYLNYSSLGLQLILVGREPDKLGMIIANPMDLDSLARNDFAGQSDKGIRIGSTRAEVIAGYGPPEPLPPGDKRPPQAEAWYKHLAMGFRFVDGKVTQIILQRRD